MTQKELEDLIIYHQNKYYNSEPEIEDWEFDELWDELENTYPNSELIKKVGDEGKINDNKFPHVIHMGSQEKINTYDGIKDWIRLKNIQLPLVVEEKIDGLSVELHYKDGKLIQALTRGDGHFGKDITDNVRLMNVPKEVDFIGDAYIRGEIVLPTNNINKLIGFNEIKNPRNIASGIANQKDSKDNLELLDIICYDIILTETEIPSEVQKMVILGERFKIPSVTVVSDYNELITEIERIHNERGCLEYQIDGAVMKQNSIPTNADKSKARPDWQRAFKYPVEKFVTKLIDIEWNRNGYNFTPVAILKSVEIDNTVVSRASLANLGEVKRLGIKLPCDVEIAKQNEIIPKVHKVIKYYDDSSDFAVPTICPICGEILNISDTNIQCTNKLCKTRAEHKIKKWIDTIGSLGFGEALIQYLVYECNITEIKELYCNDIVSAILQKTQLKKATEKAFADLWARSKNINLWDFIAGFDIEGIGSKVVKLIVDNGYNTIDLIRQVNYDNLVNISGFGKCRSKIFVEQIKYLENEMDGVLNTNRVTIRRPVEKINNSITFCITGLLSRSRKEYENLLIEKGHKLANSVTKSVSYLVNNDINSTSSKNLTAKKNGVPIITEEEFLRIING